MTPPPAASTDLVITRATPPPPPTDPEDRDPLARVLALARVLLSLLTAFSLYALTTPVVAVAGSGLETYNVTTDAGAVVAVPALFGRRLSGPEDGWLVCAEGDGCAGVEPAEGDGSWVLLPRGGCPFDVKAANAARAGHAGLLVRSLRVGEAPVRMGAHRRGAEARDVAAGYLTARDGARVAASCARLGGRAPLRVDVVSAPGVGAGGWTMGVFGFGVGVGACAVVMLCLRLCAPWLPEGGAPWPLERSTSAVEVQRAERGELDKADEGLDQIALPLKVIVADDLEGAVVGGSSVCCPICIDEFEIGSRVRRLPCRHQFHDTCIDPWLLNHNRLCPICKRDVLALPAGAQAAPASPTGDATPPNNDQPAPEAPHAPLPTTPPRRWLALLTLALPTLALPTFALPPMLLFRARDTRATDEPPLLSWPLLWSTLDDAEGEGEEEEAPRHEPELEPSGVARSW